MLHVVIRTAGRPQASNSGLLPGRSGGQKARVVFTAICLSKPHILLLDEPTNHLDMQVWAAA